MADIKAIDQIVQKWSRRVATASPEYEFGVKNANKDWGKNAAAASDSWKTGVQAAIVDDRFKKGVTAAGTATWQAGAAGKGVQRWAPGVAESTGKYQTAISPFIEAYKRLSLPPRYARRDPRNQARVNAVNQLFIETAKARR